uniref:Surfactant protein C n=1 Tax=Pelodiscus sinensis TaxID=13735 RepID=K7FH50_PELSI
VREGDTEGGPERPPAGTAMNTGCPRVPGFASRLKKLLIVVVVVVVIVVVVLGFLLMGLRLSEKHTETVLRMTIQSLDGEGSPQQLSIRGKEKTGTFYVTAGINSSATVVYDYRHLLIGYRSWPGRACYLRRMDPENIPGLDAIAKAFQHRQVSGWGQRGQRRARLGPSEEPEEGGFPAPQANRSALGTTVNILCSNVPIYWA